MKLQKNKKYYLSPYSYPENEAFLVQTERQHNAYLNDTVAHFDQDEEIIYEVTVTKIIRVNVKTTKELIIKEL